MTYTQELFEVLEELGTNDAALFHIHDVTPPEDQVEHEDEKHLRLYVNKDGRAHCIEVCRTVLRWDKEVKGRVREWHYNYASLWGSISPEQCVNFIRETLF